MPRYLLPGDVDMSIRPAATFGRFCSLMLVACALLLGACADREVPTANDAAPQPQNLIVGSSPFSMMDAGGYNNCAVREDGVVQCWGYNYYGSAPATKSASVGEFTQVAPGYLSACALRDDGVAECWGY